VVWLCDTQKQHRNAYTRSTEKLQVLNKLTTNRRHIKVQQMMATKNIGFKKKTPFVCHMTRMQRSSFNVD